jgi:hypothetical protein
MTLRVVPVLILKNDLQIKLMDTVLFAFQRCFHRFFP